MVHQTRLLRRGHVNQTHVLQTLDDLSEADLARVAEFLDFLKFRNRFHAASIPNEIQVAEIYAEFAEAGRVLAEKGMPDYMAGLRRRTFGRSRDGSSRGRTQGIMRRCATYCGV